MTKPLSSADINIFYQKSVIFVLLRNTEKKLHFKALLLILLTLLEFLKVLLIKIVDILMMSAKFATLDLLKIKVT